MTRTSPAFLDEDLEVAARSHGQYWTPDTGQPSMPVYTLPSVREDQVAHFWLLVQRVRAFEPGIMSEAKYLIFQLLGRRPLQLSA